LTDQDEVPLADPLPFPRSPDHVTATMPLVSDAVPARLMESTDVVYAGPEVGEVMTTVGAFELGVVAVEVTAITALFWLPAASRAVTVI
jgi:hypothetical protein